MSHIIVSEEQAAVIAQAGSNVQVRDPQGRLIGYIKLTPGDEKHASPGEAWPSAEELAELKARLSIPQPTYTTAEVLEHLRSLDRR